MRFYHCFYTDLPDQFVEANASALIKWVDGWQDKNRYYHRSMVVDTLPIDVIGDSRKEDWPTLTCKSAIMVKHWMQRKGDQYNGGYWESLEEDQRSAAGIAGIARGKYPIWTNPYSSAAANTLTAASLAAARRLMVAQAPAGGFMPAGAWASRIISWDLAAEKPKPPLKRDGIIAGEIIGHRAWRVENGLLTSVYQADVWIPGQILEGRELGDWDERGIHAWKPSATKEYHDYIRYYLNQETTDRIMTLMALYATLPDHVQRSRRPAMVTGTVFLWGDVVEHERGWRAEYARVRSLDWLYPDDSMMLREQETLDALRSRYGVQA